MSVKVIHECECEICQQEASHPEKEIHHQMNVLLSRLDEQQRRWYVALEAKPIGRGGLTKMHQISGLSLDTIRRGRDELEADLKSRPVERVRQEGGGRQRIEKKSQRLSRL